MKKILPIILLLLSGAFSGILAQEGSEYGLTTREQMRLKNAEERRKKGENLISQGKYATGTKAKRASAKNLNKGHVYMKAANRLKYQVYRKALVRNKQKTSPDAKIKDLTTILINEARAYFDRADSIRLSSKNSHPDVLNKKWTTAYRMEILGIKRLKQGMALYRKLNNMKKSSPGQKFNVDQAVLNKLFTYLENKDYKLKTLSSSQGNNGEVSPATISEIWQSYANKPIFAYTEEESDQEQAQEKTGTDNDKTTKESAQSKDKASGTYTTQKPKKKVDKSETETANQIYYAIQIAADYKPLKQEILNQRYSKGKITEHYVKGLYKYTIQNFSSYPKAKAHKKQTSVKGAFVTAYISDKLLPIDYAIHKTNPDYYKKLKDWEKSADNASEQIYFSIQVGAFSAPKSGGVLKRLYGDLPVKEYKEAGMYKYRTGEFSSYREAKKRLKSIPVEAFIIALKDGKRFPLHLARKLKRARSGG